MAPDIRKLGTIDCDLVETTPIVFRGRLYRFEYVRPGYWANTTGDSYFRFVDHGTGEVSPSFAKGYHLGNVMVKSDSLIVTAADLWDGEKIDIFVSTDMERWEKWNALHQPGWGFFNTSLCWAEGRYVLMVELGKPPELVGVAFTAFFAESQDLKHWRVLPQECNYSRDRYTAPHALRYLNGWFYNFHLEHVPAEDGFEQRVVRSQDLIHWEASPHNPVLHWSEEDRVVANPNLPRDLVQRIQEAENRNNSDIDFCEYQGQVAINYSWGNQRGIEFLAEAVFEGTEAQFLEGWFVPEMETRDC